MRKFINYKTPRFSVSRKSKKVKSGVYSITCTVTGKIYIGRTKNICERIRNHKKKLKNGTHYNKQLLADYQQYSIENFKFEILERLSPTEAELLECKLIQRHKIAGISYNIKNVRTSENEAVTPE